MHSEAIRLESESKLLISAADLLDKQPETPKAVPAPIREAA
jgi:hypothetical protein